MTAILDQKHYIEELNRHLSGTVTDLQAKMDSLEKTNGKLVEEVRCTVWELLRDNECDCTWGMTVAFVFGLIVFLFISWPQQQTGSTLCGKNRSSYDRRTSPSCSLARKRKRS